MQKEIMYAIPEGEFPKETDNDTTLKDTHDDYYDSRSIIPTDNVDADGVPWATVGENIRKGSKEVSHSFVEKIYSTLLGVDVEILTIHCKIVNNKFVIDTNKVYAVDLGLTFKDRWALISINSNTLGVADQSITIALHHAVNGTYLKLRSGPTINVPPLTIVVAIEKK